MSSLHHFEFFDPSSPTRSWFLVVRPKWPYRLGIIGGPMFGLSLLLFLLARHLPGDASEKAMLLAVLGGVLAGVMLGGAWAGVLRLGQGGVGPMAGSLAFPLAVVYAVAQRGSDDMRTIASVIVGSLAAFAWGHVAARVDAVLRVFAAASAILWTLVFIAVVKQWDMPRALPVVSLSALAVTSVCLVFWFLQLRDAPPDQEL
jgi:hypothetical protein